MFFDTNFLLSKDQNYFLSQIREKIPSCVIPHSKNLQKKDKNNAIERRENRGKMKRIGWKKKKNTFEHFKLPRVETNVWINVN